MEKLIFISVVRDFEMYDNLVRENKNNKGAEFVFFDNREHNNGIAERYNSFLAGYDYNNSAWFVFCHEDWETKEELFIKLSGLSTDCIYGPIGSASIVTSRNVYRYTRGFCRQSDRNGRRVVTCKGLMPDGVVDTFDCQCIIVHSSLVQRYSLRFDEHFTFDLYVEDFCIGAYERYGIISKILPINCQHWSYGNITDRFYKLKVYLDTKYNGIYSTIAGAEVIGKAGRRRIVSFGRFFLNHPEKYYILMKYGFKKNL